MKILILALSTFIFASVHAEQPLRTASTNINISQLSNPDRGKLFKDKPLKVEKDLRAKNKLKF